ncbi:MAG: hypothetical protein K2F87_00445, partial [Muribaculaceae bacterium]|nr:hypothetical protein [Muribaculaceae bacterium]
MKYSILFASGLLAAAVLTSCSLDNDVKEQTVTTTMSQLIIPDDASKDVTFQHKCQYSMKMDLNAGTMEITSGDIRLGGSSNSFSLGPVKYSYGYNALGESFLFRNAQGRYGTQNVEDASGYLTTLMPVASRTSALVMSYHTAGVTVKTFMSTPVFGGTTTTYYY